MELNVKSVIKRPLYQVASSETGSIDLALDSLPPNLAVYVRELVTRYSVPASAIVPACLVTAGAAVGHHATIRTGLGTGAMPTNLFVVTSADPASNLNFALQHVIEPFRKFQRDAYAEHARTNREEALAALETAQRHRHDRMRHVNYYHDDSAYLQYTFITDQLMRRLNPVMALDSFTERSIRKALQQNGDGGLFFIPQDLVAAPADIDLDLLARSTSRRSFSDLFDKNVPPSASTPAISGLMLCTPAQLAALQTNRKWNSPNIHCGAVFVKGYEKPSRITDAVFEPLSSQGDWENQIQAIVAMRSWAELPCRVTRGAASIMANFRNELVSECEGLSLEDACRVMTWTGLSWRFAFSLWLVDTAKSGPLDEQIATAAVVIAKYYRPTFPVVCYDDEPDEVIEEIIITRIRKRGPIRRRELYRTFNRQHKALHEPVISRLLAAGRLAEDPKGRLVLPCQ